VIEYVDIKEFLSLKKELPIIDVRSPIEYNHAHIPDSYNVYLFKDEERKEIGTLYKQKGREEAVLKGLEFASGRMTSLLKSIDAVVKDKVKDYKNTNKILMHCFRGGMRSGSVAWLCSNYKYDVYILKGGYKSYRRYVLDSFDCDYRIYLLTGKTGSGKTLILNKLKELGNNVIDLENIAKHKGSAFGWINEGEQPTQEQFENDLSEELRKYDKDSILWLEDESLLIGKRTIPKSLFNRMKEPEKIIYLHIPKERRAKYITEAYGKFRIEDLGKSILKIKNRLGGERTKEALNLLGEGRIYECVLTLLYYYDKSYRLNVVEDKITDIYGEGLDFEAIANLILSKI